MKKACVLLLILLPVALTACGTGSSTLCLDGDCCGRNYEELEYNLLVRIIVGICVVLVKGLLSGIIIFLGLWGLVLFLFSVPIDLFLSLISLKFIFPLTRSMWCLEIFLKDTVINIWTVLPPHFIF